MAGCGVFAKVGGAVGGKTVGVVAAGAVAVSAAVTVSPGASPGPGGVPRRVSRCLLRGLPRRVSRGVREWCGYPVGPGPLPRAVLPYVRRAERDGRPGDAGPYLLRSPGAAAAAGGVDPAAGCGRAVAARL
ncbi:hypothetical protein Slala05_50110 [Streptomyces lavendulae subsp. lavendulae]|nr:hypothetical protein Slala05_50110 [Streptomyces lavendulae subsp. lavendulae]